MGEDGLFPPGRAEQIRLDQDGAATADFGPANRIHNRKETFPQIPIGIGSAPNDNLHHEQASPIFMMTGYGKTPYLSNGHNPCLDTSFSEIMPENTQKILGTVALQCYRFASLTIVIKQEVPR
jgi:hypothetical protein